MDHWSAARQPLRSFALRLCRDQTQADDLMQQTALQAWTARPPSTKSSMPLM
jgi:DNA-directed RNA polymerase specialized sigma24 family protein